jgi:hypothetical protein
MSYAEWKTKAAAELSGPIAMTERQWRQLFIKGRSPSEAAAEAETYRRNTFRPR